MTNCEAAVIRLIAAEYFRAAIEVVVTYPLQRVGVGFNLFSEAMYHASKMAFLRSLAMHDISILINVKNEKEFPTKASSDVSEFLKTISKEVAAHHTHLLMLRAYWHDNEFISTGKWRLLNYEENSFMQSRSFFFSVIRGTSEELLDLLPIFEQTPKDHATRRTINSENLNAKSELLYNELLRIYKDSNPKRTHAKKNTKKSK